MSFTDQPPGKSNLIFATGLLGFLLFFMHSGAQTLRSVKPLFSEEQAVPVPQAQGLWAVSEQETLQVEPGGDNFYRVTFSDKAGLSTHEGIFTPAGDGYFLHLYPVEKRGTYLGRLSSMPLWLVYQVTVSDSQLVIRNLDVTRFSKLDPQHFSAFDDNGMMAVSGFGKIRDLLADPENTDSLLTGDFPVKRIKYPEPKRKDQLSNNPPKSKISEYHKISGLAEFTYNSGWLGGDGTLSVRLTEDKVMWIFSDSFVSENTGAKTRREANGMVSNTIAVTDWGTSPRETAYFWRKRQGEHFPYFETGTGRYRFWPVWAFNRNDTVFVFLNKVGPKEIPDPDGPFNFRITGTTLALVTGISEPDPLKWTIDLIPFSGIYPDETWAQGATDEQYLYVVKNFNRENFLTRIPLNSLTSHPESSVEYWTKDGKWKKGSSGEDRMILFTEQANGSLEYYPDLKVWLYVYGPNFMSNEIRFRYAPEITGPWSEAGTLSRTPEQQAESPVYDKRYFCYLARAHSFLYDAAGKKLTVTYDCNSVDFSHVSKDDFSYVPRMISVRVPERITGQ